MYVQKYLTLKVCINNNVFTSLSSFIVTTLFVATSDNKPTDLILVS